MAVQAQIPPAICALHNFILDNDPCDIDNYLSGTENDCDPTPGQIPSQDNDFRTLASEAVTGAERECGAGAWDRIAETMWLDYQAVLAQREQAGSD